MNKTALIAGATGMVGSSVLDYLLNEMYYQKVIVLTRRPLSISHLKVEEMIVNFDDLKNVHLSEPIDDAYCCLGTTMKKAGSKEAFYEVDFHYPFETAKLALRFEARQFLIVTAIGASKNSRFFYSQVKGEVEEALWKLNFEGLHIFRPSLLLGDRKESRLGEKMGEIIMSIFQPLLISGLRKYRAIEGTTVAMAMYKTAQEGLKGNYIYESDQIKEICKGKFKLHSLKN